MVGPLRDHDFLPLTHPTYLGNRSLFTLHIISKNSRDPHRTCKGPLHSNFLVFRETNCISLIIFPNSIDPHFGAHRLLVRLIPDDSTPHTTFRGLTKTHLELVIVSLTIPITPLSLTSIGTTNLRSITTRFLEKTDSKQIMTLMSDEPAVIEVMEETEEIKGTEIVTEKGTEVTGIDLRNITEMASLVQNVQGVNETVANTAVERKGNE